MGIDRKKTVPNPLAELEAAQMKSSETTRKAAPSALVDLDDLDDLDDPDFAAPPTAMKVASRTAAFMELDEPTFSEMDQAPVTRRPDYDAQQLALEIESADDRMTVPPSPTYDMLRDSCSSAIAEEIPLDEDEILRPSRKIKLKP
jgi:hypothetical protein